MTGTRQGASSQQHESTPTYTEPTPGLAERVSMKLAAVAVGVKKGSTPTEVMSKFITTYGDYKPKDPNNVEGDRTTPERPLFVRETGDSTRMHSLLREEGKPTPAKRSYTSGNAFHEAKIGVDLASAVRAENQRTPKGRVPIREKVARGLMKRAGRDPRKWEQGRR